MTFSTIMVHLELEHSNDACLRTAIDLAGRFNAKLIGIAAASIPWSFYGQEGLTQGLVDQMSSEIVKQLADAEVRFRSAARHAPQIEWRSAIEPTANYVSREARAADLVVIGAKRNGLLLDPALGHLDPGDLVMRAGRPVFVVPPKVEGLKLQCALVAWKDAREARRAVNDALPLLQKVQQVVVVEVIEDESDRSAAHSRLDDVVPWLDRHGIAALARVFHFPDDKEPMEKLYQYGADFIVAGAYGHAQLREWVFGGFTHDLLTRCPQHAFLAH